MLNNLYLTCLCPPMQNHGTPSASSSNANMTDEHGGKTDGTEGKTIPWMVQQHVGAETTAESSMEEVCGQQFDNYLEHVWRPAAHESIVSLEQCWQRREYLW